jgi:hypothetical protein
MTDDLVKRLRNINGGWAPDEALAAADRIEELETKLAKAVEKAERLGREVNIARYGQPDFAWDIHKAAMADLEAKLAKVLVEMRLLIDVSVLMQTSGSYNRHRHQHEITDTIWSQWSKQLKTARNTLASLQGDKV